MAKTITREEAFDFSDPQDSGSAKPDVSRTKRARGRARSSKSEEGKKEPHSMKEAGTRRGAERSDSMLIRRTWLIPEDTAHRFKVACAQRGLNASDIVGSLIEDWLVRFDK